MSIPMKRAKRRHQRARRRAHVRAPGRVHLIVRCDTSQFTQKLRSMAMSMDEAASVLRRLGSAGVKASASLANLRSEMETR